MVLLFSAVVLILATVVFTFGIRPKDLPKPEPVSPTRHLEERKAAIYENLRDLQFEYRVGKLSDVDYQATKTGLQKELAVVLAEIESFKPGVRTTATAAPAEPPASKFQCPHCSATFDKVMKFCGECGKEMA